MKKSSYLLILLFLLPLLLFTGCNFPVNPPTEEPANNETGTGNVMVSDVIPGGVISTLPGEIAVTPSETSGAYSASDPAGRQVITLSSFLATPQDEIVKAVAAFNQSNAEYYVQIHTATSGTSVADYWDREMLELMNGGGPDLFTKSSQINFMTYLEKGILEDLAPYIDRDIDKDAYWENSLYAYAKDGKVYAIEPSFQLSFYMGDNELFEGRTNWNLQEAIKLMEAHPEYKFLNNDYPPETVLRELLCFSSMDYSDFEAVRSTLEFAKTYGNPLATGIRIMGPATEASLISPENISSLLGFADCDAVYGSKCIPIGYINEQHSGVLHSSIAWSINSNSKQKEGAWAFLRFLLSEEYQRREERYNFSPLKVILEEQLEYYSEPRTITMYDPNIDSNFTVPVKHTLPRAFCIPGCVKEIDCMSEEQLQTVVNLIEASHTNAFDWNVTLINIITEESGAYFNDQRSLDDVMTNIQSRIGLYMEEQE